MPYLDGGGALTSLEHYLHCLKHLAHMCRRKRGHRLPSGSSWYPGAMLGAADRSLSLPEGPLVHCLLPTAAPVPEAPVRGPEISFHKVMPTPVQRALRELKGDRPVSRNPWPPNQGRLVEAGLRWQTHFNVSACRALFGWTGKHTSGECFWTVPNSFLPPGTGKPRPRECPNRATWVALVAREGTQDTGMLAGIY